MPGLRSLSRPPVTTRRPYQFMRLKKSRVGSGGCSARQCAQKNSSPHPAPLERPQFQHCGAKLFPAATLLLDSLLPRNPASRTSHKHSRVRAPQPHIRTAACWPGSPDPRERRKERLAAYWLGSRGGGNSRGKPRRRVSFRMVNYNSQQALRLNAAVIFELSYWSCRGGRRFDWLKEEFVSLCLAPHHWRRSCRVCGSWWSHAVSHK